MAPTRTLPAEGLGYVVLAGALMTQAAIAIDSLVPGLPDIVADLGMTPGSVQLTISLYMAGFALGQIAWGWASDWVGRRPVILAGTTGYIVAAAMCALADSGGTLIAWRLVQGFAAAATMASVRAMMRDHFSGIVLARKMAALNAVYMLSPILAPQLGALLVGWFGWRSTLLVPGSVALAALLVAWQVLAESHPPERRKRRLPRDVLNIARDMFTHPLSGLCLGVQGAMSIGLLTWIATSPLLVTGHYARSVFVFSLVFAGMATVMLTGSVLCNQLLKRVGPQWVMGLGATFIALGGGATVLGTLFADASLTTLFLTVAVYFIGFGLVVPSSGGMALHAFGAMGGLAAAIVGCTQGLVGSAGAMLFARLFDGTPRALGLGMGLSTVLAVAFAATLCRRLVLRPDLLAHPEALVMIEETT